MSFPLPRSAGRFALVAAATLLVACADGAAPAGEAARAAAADSAPADAPAAGPTGGPTASVADAASAPAPLTDDAGVSLPVPTGPLRVVSLTPSATELIAALGRLDVLVGRTTWDDYPDAVTAVPDLGPGLRPNVESVLAAQPTLVVLYASSENRGAAAALERAGVTVVQLRTESLADVWRNALLLGRVLGAERAAAAFVDSTAATIDAVRAAVADAERVRVVWPSWDGPVMVAGGGSYEHELLGAAGAENVFADREEAVVTVSLEEIARRDPDVVLAAPDRIARFRDDERWRGIGAVRGGRFVVLDTTVVGRPGARIGMAAVAIARALHPERADRLP